MPSSGPSVSCMRQPRWVFSSVARRHWEVNYISNATCIRSQVSTSCMGKRISRDQSRRRTQHHCDSGVGERVGFCPSSSYASHTRSMAGIIAWLILLQLRHLPLAFLFGRASLIFSFVRLLRSSIYLFFARIACTTDCCLQISRSQNTRLLRMVHS